MLSAFPLPIFSIQFKLLSEERHKSVIIILKTDIVVIDFLGGDKTVMIANVLILFCNLRLDVVKLLVQRTGFFGFAFCPLAFTSHKGRDTSLLQQKPAWAPLTVIRLIIGALPFFTDCFLI